MSRATSSGYAPVDLKGHPDAKYAIGEMVMVKIDLPPGLNRWYLGTIKYSYTNPVAPDAVYYEINVIRLIVDDNRARRFRVEWEGDVHALDHATTANMLAQAQ